MTTLNPPSRQVTESFGNRMPYDFVLEVVLATCTPAYPSFPSSRQRFLATFDRFVLGTRRLGNLLVACCLPAEYTVTRQCATYPVPSITRAFLERRSAANTIRPYVTRLLPFHAIDHISTNEEVGRPASGRRRAPIAVAGCRSYER